MEKVELTEYSIVRNSESHWWNPSYSVDSIRLSNMHPRSSNCLSSTSVVILHRHRCCLSHDDNFQQAVDVGMILDGACDSWFLMEVEEIRLSLPLNSKRPTVDRRFWKDSNGIVIRKLETLIQMELERWIRSSTRAGSQSNIAVYSYANPYLRILEYHQSGSGLLPHTDGIKICDETGQKSTHTLLLFLTDCEEGGETILLDEKMAWTSVVTTQAATTAATLVQDANHQKASQTLTLIPENRVVGTILQVDNSMIVHDLSSKEWCPWKTCSNQSQETSNRERNTTMHKSLSSPSLLSKTSDSIYLGVAPRRGRILLFPHSWPHAGAACQSLPKILLRAEITIRMSR
jgi:hypothetical protein